MYKKVLYNIKKMKKCGGEGERAMFEPKTPSLYLKKKKKKKVTKKKIRPSRDKNPRPPG